MIHSCSVQPFELQNAMTSSCSDGIGQGGKPQKLPQQTAKKNKNPLLDLAEAMQQCQCNLE